MLRFLANLHTLRPSAYIRLRTRLILLFSFHRILLVFLGLHLSVIIDLAPYNYFLRIAERNYSNIKNFIIKRVV